MGRPLGSKSKEKNKKRKVLSCYETKKLLEEYGTMTNSQLIEKYNISAAQLKKLRKQYNVKPKDLSHLFGKKIDFSSRDKICGVYVICNTSLTRAYIGSSVDIIKRVQSHIASLSSGRHCNRALLSDFQGGVNFYYFIVRECSEQDLLRVEQEIIDSVNFDALYNKSRNTTKTIDVDKIPDDRLNKYTVSEEGCWIWGGSISKHGYGKMNISGETLALHRVWFTKKYGYTPPLIHHVCNNKLCCNPDHLRDASVADNNRATRINMGVGTTSKLYPYRDEIIRLRQEGYTLKHIREKIGVNQSLPNFWRFLKIMKEGGYVGEF